MIDAHRLKFEAGTLTGDFDFDGLLQVQSRQLGRRGRLAGRWLSPREGVISANCMNEALARDARWSGVPINLLAAAVTTRAGMFHEVPDNLYKIDSYEPLNGGERFPAHIVDVFKAVEQWHRRFPLVSSLFGEPQSTILASLTGRLEDTIPNEYLCHEGGHVLGWSVQTKSARGYFALGGKILWPLVWVEEFRADLHSYSVALEVTSARAAASIFIYNCLARFAGDAVSVREQTYGYGTIPFLLFCLLSEVGFLETIRWKSGLKLAVAGTSISDIVFAIKECQSHALKEITDAELSTDDPLEWGINAARYYRRRVLENPLHADYIQLLTDAS